MAPSELYMSVDSMCISSVAIGCPIFIVGKVMPLLVSLLTVAILLIGVNPVSCICTIPFGLVMFCCTMKIDMLTAGSAVQLCSSHLDFQCANACTLPETPPFVVLCIVPSTFSMVNYLPIRD